MLKNKYSYFLLLIIPLTFAGLSDLMAAPSDVYGLGTKDSGQSQASQISLPGSFSAKGNPALLPLGQKLFSLESYGQFYWLKDANISSANNTPPSGIPTDKKRASKTKPNSNFALGISLSLSQKLGIGVAGRFPGDSVAKIHAFTQNEANYLHFNDRQSRPEIFTAFGYALTDHFSLGAGLYYSIKAKGTMQLGISQTDAESRLFLEMTPEFIPYLGMAQKFSLFNEETIIGLNYRFEQKASSTINVDLDFNVGLGTIPFSTSSSLIAFYDPAVLGLGVSRLGKKIQTSFSYEWSQWSRYKAPVISLTGKDLEVLNSDRTLATNIKLRDTHSFRLGMEFPHVYENEEKILTLRWGSEYHTSAVDENASNITVVDSNKLGISTGASYKIPYLKPLINMPLTLDSSLKLVHLFEKKFSDQNKNQGRKSKSGGNVAVLMLGVTFEL